MDVSKYKDNFELVEAFEEDGILTQAYYSSIDKVKYVRVVWSNLFEEDVEITKLLLSSQFKLMKDVLPNIVKLELGNNYMESLYFEDDDIEFNIKRLIHPFILKNYGKKLSLDAMVTDMDEYNKNYNELIHNREYIGLMKDVYKDYLDKEL